MPDIKHESPQVSMKGEDTLIVMLSEIDAESVKEACIRVANSPERPDYADTLSEILFQSVQADARRKHPDSEDSCENKE